MALIVRKVALETISELRPLVVRIAGRDQSLAPVASRRLFENSTAPSTTFAPHSGSAKPRERDTNEICVRLRVRG